jgi:cytochrome c oxidase subunit 3
MVSRSPTVPHQFDDAGQQREASTIGMWLLIATEILFFGAMFLGYTAYRSSYPQAFAEASRHTLIVLGGNQRRGALISRTTMAVAVLAARENRRWLLVWFLLLTASLGGLFLVIKGFEYAKEISEHLLPGSSFHIEAADPAKAEMFFLHLLADDRRACPSRNDRHRIDFDLCGARLLHQRLREPPYVSGSAGPLLAFC